MPRYELVSAAEDVAAGKQTKVADALFRSPAGELSLARVAVVGLDWYGAAGTDLHSEVREWLGGNEAAQLREQAARLGATLVLGIRERYRPELEEFRQLRRLYRQTFGDFSN